MYYPPDRIVASGVLYTGSIAFFRYITIYVLLKQVRGQNTVHKVLPYVRVIEVVLKQRGYLRIYSVRCGL
jgi:hypothetical protein